MEHFSIRDMENMSGIKAHTLRVWEQRYGLCLCKRKKSLHRYYDNEDLKHILRISYLYHNGYKISGIAALSPDAILHLATSKVEKQGFDLPCRQLVEACLDFDQNQFERILDTVITGLGVEKAVVKVIYPFMEKIGLLWLTNHVIPGQEHFCSHLVLKKLVSAVNALPPVADNAKKKIALFAPEGEQHEIPLLLAQYLFKKAGHKTVYFGRDTSISSLKAFCTVRPVTHFYFHLITNFTSRDTSGYVQTLATAFPAQKIIASGPALKSLDFQPPNLYLLQSPKELIDLPKKL